MSLQKSVCWGAGLRVGPFPLLSRVKVFDFFFNVWNTNEDLITLFHYLKRINYSCIVYGLHFVADHRICPNNRYFQCMNVNDHRWECTSLYFQMSNPPLFKTLKLGVHCPVFLLCLNSVAMTLQEDGVFGILITDTAVGLWPTGDSVYTFVANCKLLINLFNI